MVAMFSCSSVTTYTMSMPPKQLEFSKSITSDWLKEEFENVCLYSIFTVLYLLI